MKGTLEVHRVLLSADLPHEIVRLPHPVLTATEIPAIADVPPASCVVVTVYIVESGPVTLTGVAAIAAADRPADPAALSSALGGAVLRPAEAAEVNELTDFVAGLVSPVCLPPALPVFVDARLAGQDVLYAATGESGTVLAIRLPDLLRVVRARVADLSPRLVFLPVEEAVPPEVSPRQPAPARRS